jgi:hypothetical protein
MEINKSRLYITNLPQSITADNLINLFMPFGQINKVVMKLEYSLVYYADVLSVTEAIKHMDGYLIEGRRIVVKGSQPCPTNVEDHAFSQSGITPMKEIDMANLYVGGVPLSVTCVISLWSFFAHLEKLFKRGGFIHTGMAWLGMLTLHLLLPQLTICMVTILGEAPLL